MSDVSAIRWNQLWVVHESQCAADGSTGTTVHPVEIRASDVSSSVDTFTEEPPTQRYVQVTACQDCPRAIEFVPEDRPSQRWHVVDTERRGRPTIARCRSIEEAEGEARVRKAV